MSPVVIGCNRSKKIKLYCVLNQLITEAIEHTTGEKHFSKYRARKPGTSPYIVVVVRADHPLIIRLFR
jgi:hypothetical protein